MSTSTVSSSTYLNSILAAQQTASTTTTEEEDPLGRDAFLTMLMAQLTHQDPLNPMEDTEFSSQLAQFSSLEQMYNMNESLTEILTELQSGTQEPVVDYIGKEITATNNTLYLSGEDYATSAFTLDEAADVIISITDSSGIEVRQLYMNDLEAGAWEFEWDGYASDGTYLEDGTYYYQVLAENEDGGYYVVDSQIQGTVTGVQYSNGKAYLDLNGVLIDPDTVVAVTTPEAEETGDGETDEQQDA